MSQMTLKTIYDLLGEKFIVPYYQRGYRWGKSQVEQLLNDIWNFRRDKTKSENEFYCLQPIVVKETKDGWELIDGQQRLTTIYLILKFVEYTLLKGDKLETDYGKPIFEIDYHVRERSKEFLNNINIFRKQKLENIDFYYMAEAFDKIASYFDYPNKFNRSELDDFLKVLLYQVKVIWYKVPKATDSIEIFTRLNIGKIPLTNAELIKALFLNSSNFKGSDQEQIRLRQLQIAAGWDEMERTLQKDEFWFFIFDKNNRKFSDRNYDDTRIEYIFDLIKRRPKDAEDYYTFYKFYEDLKKHKDRKGSESKYIESLWREIKRFFYTLKEWYEDNEFYHLIGYLIAAGKDITSIKDEYDKKTKSEFKKYLKEKIYKTINNGDSNMDDAIKELEYGDEKVKKVLLLFNILILLNNKGANVRFPFDRYKKENWDIEHVFSQTDVELKGKALKEYVKLILEFWTGEKIETEQLDENAIKELEQKLDKSGGFDEGLQQRWELKRRV